MTLQHIIITCKAEAEELKSMITQTAVLFIRLKQVNREAQLSAETLKQNAQQSRNQVDKLNLQLQNLAYEKAHIKKQITHCKDFVYCNITKGLLMLLGRDRSPSHWFHWTSSKQKHHRSFEILQTSISYT